MQLLSSATARRYVQAAAWLLRGTAPSPCDRPSWIFPPSSISLTSIRRPYVSRALSRTFGNAVANQTHTALTWKSAIFITFSRCSLFTHSTQLTSKTLCSAQFRHSALGSPLVASRIPLYGFLCSSYQKKSPFFFHHRLWGHTIRWALPCICAHLFGSAEQLRSDSRERHLNSD